MQITIDYRPALRARSGVGEYVHQLACAWRQAYPGDVLTLFTSSWKDRPAGDLQIDVPDVRVADHRVPVRLLNFAWHNLEWPPVEWLVRGSCDVAFSPHPLLLPARAAAQVVMVHDLDFLRHPERTHREIRRDYPRLAAAHARRADRVIVPSRFTAHDVHCTLGVARERIAVCPPGVPAWPEPCRGFDRNGYLLFMGTLEPRKNVAGLLVAYRKLLVRGVSVPKLVLAGNAGPVASACLEAISHPPFAGNVTYLGYVAQADRQRVYAGARALLLPSLEEGFGMPALEAMSLGIPVLASRRGGLPDLVGDAGVLVDPADEEALSNAMIRILADNGLADALARRGLSRAACYSWRRTAGAVREAFLVAINCRLSRSAARSRTALRTAPETATRRSTALRESAAIAESREP